LNLTVLLGIFCLDKNIFGITLTNAIPKWAGNSVRKCLTRTIFIVFLTGLVQAQYTNLNHTNSKVLIINSYHRGFMWSDEIVSEIERVILEDDPAADIRIEYMDTRHHPDSAYLDHWISLLRRKYYQASLDLIITIDNGAYEFLLKYHDRFFPGVPAVFCGLNDFVPGDTDTARWYTGVAEVRDLEGTIEMMRHLHPAAKNIYTVHGGSVPGIAASETEVQALRKAGYWRIHPLSGAVMDTRSLIDTLNHVSKSDLVFFSIWSQDKDGRAYSAARAAELVSENCPAPVYAMRVQYMGHGIVGGHMLHGGTHGKITGEMAVKILHGIPVSDIPILTQDQGAFYFDYRQLQRFNIPLRSLPEKSLILYKPVTFFERHRFIILISFLIILTQSVWIVLMTINNQRRKKAEKDLLFEDRLLHALMDYIPDSIYFKDRQSCYIQNNAAHLKALGLSDQSEILGKSDADFYAPEHASQTLTDEQFIFRTGEPIIDKVEEIKNPDGSAKWVSTTKAPVKENHEIKILVGVSRDITRRIMAETQLKKSLAEKEFLLKEIHHRVKNNLQVISSLLNLQAAGLKDKATAALFRDSQNRIHSMALIHEYLYRTQDLSNIDFRKYVQDLINAICRIQTLDPAKYHIKYDISGIALDINTAVPCGLILNEVVTNIFKHAFPPSFTDRPEIVISFRVEKGTARLVVSDNGIGIQHPDRIHQSGSLGLRLIRILSEDQLQGTLNVEKGPGTTFRITFDMDRKKTHTASS